MWPFPNQSGVFGLDIGYETLKLVELKDRHTLSGMCNFALTDRILEKDCFKDINATADMIKQVCTSAKPFPIKGQKIVSSLPETFVFSKTVQMPTMSAEEYREAIPTEASQYLPIPIDEVYLDYQVLSTHPDKPLSELLIVATPKRLADEYAELANKAGLELIALETKPLAVGRALIGQGQSKGIAIVEIGTEVTRISIWDKGSIHLVTSVDVGKNQIAHTVNLDDKSNVFGNKADEAGIIAPIIDELVAATRYHQNRDYQPDPVTKILLCGSGAKFNGIDKYVEKKTSTKTEIASPDIRGKIQPGPEFVTAYGLALRNEYE